MSHRSMRGLPGQIQSFSGRLPYVTGGWTRSACDLLPETNEVKSYDGEEARSQQWEPDSEGVEEGREDGK